MNLGQPEEQQDQYQTQHELPRARLANRLRVHEASIRWPQCPRDDRRSFKSHSSDFVRHNKSDGSQGENVTDDEPGLANGEV